MASETGIGWHKLVCAVALQPIMAVAIKICKDFFIELLLIRDIFIEAKLLTNF